MKARFHKLIEQLLKEFDGKIAGVNLPETVMDINQKFFKHKFCSIYVNTIIYNMFFLKQQFKKVKLFNMLIFYHANGIMIMVTCRKYLLLHAKII